MNSRIRWEKFTVELPGGQTMVFWKIKRGPWKFLASFAPHWKCLSEEMRSHLQENWRLAEKRGYLVQGRQTSIQKGKALYNNPDVRGSSLTIQQSTGVWAGFPFVGNETKSSMQGQGLVGLDCFCPICFENGWLLPWPYSPYSIEEMEAQRDKEAKAAAEKAEDRAKAAIIVNW